MKSPTTYLTTLLVGLLTTAAHACPMCKDSIPNSDAPFASGVPSGLNTSVYFMLAGLFLVLGLVSTVIIRGIRATDQTNRLTAHQLRDR